MHTRRLLALGLLTSSSPLMAVQCVHPYTAPLCSPCPASISLHNLSNEQPPPGLLITIASLNLLQWLSISVLPLVQAARLNSLCDSLKTLGHKVRSSKIQHTETSYQYDSFLLYTSTQQLSVSAHRAWCEPTLVSHMPLIYTPHSVLVHN